ncbi:MAG: alpha/beta hydrolase [Alphaproteobacteria bacterium]|nr:alpha/beta hydrolase [Alphaproteobacteria bacterium]
MTTQDIDYLHHGDRAMTLSLTSPAGDGPFPAVIDLHGGGWGKGSRSECLQRDAVLAEAGIAAVALDFRDGADGYRSSLIDINYAVRWLKAHARDFQIDPERIGINGQSSGGHLAMLAAMRPNDPRYASLELGDAPEIDASVRCVGMFWPVINPLSRYRRVVRLRAGDDTPAWVADLPERHDQYWVTEDAMAEGNPMLALERGEAVETPPALWVQGQPDPVHDYRDPDAPVELNEPERFVANYRNAGGDIDITYIEQETRSSNTSAAPLAAFFQKHLLSTG